MHLIFSDVHFGFQKSYLNIPKNVDTLINGVGKILEGNPIEKIILAGDIFDLWTTSIKKALETGRYFLEKLSQLKPKQIIFLFGNHDNYLKEFCTVSETRSIALKHVTLQQYSGSVELEKLDYTLADYFKEVAPQVPVKIWYPGYLQELQGKKILVMHGHHFAPDQSIYPVALRTLKMVKWLLDLYKAIHEKDWEQFLDNLLKVKQLDLNEEFTKYEDDLTQFFTAIYKIQQHTKVIGKIAAFFQKKPRSYSNRTLKIDLKIIDTMLNRFFGAEIPFLIYGHTHRPEIVARKTRHLINIGSMVGNPDIADDNLNEYGSFLTFSEQSINVYRIDFRHWTEPQLFKKVSVR